MRHVRMLWPCLVAVLALSGLIASSALASEPPTVTSVSPASGPVEGSPPVTITGTGFVEGRYNEETGEWETPRLVVKFGNEEAGNVEVVSETEIKATAPHGAGAGEVEVIVEDSNGVSTGGATFTFLEEKLAFSWAKMKGCPFNAEWEGKRVAHCDYAETAAKDGGYYKVGGITVPVTKRIILQGGATPELGDETNENGEVFENHEETLLPPENGAPEIVPVAEAVPVEVLNNVTEAEMNEFNWPANLRDSYKLAKKKGYFKANKTKEIIEPAGKHLDKISTFNLLISSGTAIEANVQIKGENPWLTILGGSCSIGSEAEPIVQHLTDAVSTSPLTGEELAGKGGFLEFRYEFRMTGIRETTLVDNTYPVPGAKQCGGSNWENYLDPVVNKAFGLPAPAGASETVLDGALYTASRVATEKNLP